MDALGAAAQNPFSLAERLLRIITGALDSNVPYSQPAPERRYVAHGTPVLDLQDQLTVHLGNIRPSSGFDGADGGVLPMPKLVLLDLVVTLVNSYPTGIIQLQGGKVKAIPEEVFNEASAQSYATGCTAYLASWFGWKENCNGCDLHSISPLQPLDPEGGAAGWQFTLTAEIPRPFQEV